MALNSVSMLHRNLRRRLAGISVRSTTCGSPHGRHSSVDARGIAAERSCGENDPCTNSLYLVWTVTIVTVPFTSLAGAVAFISLASFLCFHASVVIFFECVCPGAIEFFVVFIRPFSWREH